MHRLTEVDPNVPRPKGSKGTSGSSNSSAPSSNALHIFSPTDSYHGSGRTDTPATTYSYASLKYNGSPGGAYSMIDSRESPVPSHYSQSVYSPSLHPQTPNNSPFYSSISSPSGGSIHTFQSPHATAHSPSRRTPLLSPTHSAASQHSHHNPTLSPFISPQASSFTTIYAGAPHNTPAFPSNPPYNGPDTSSSPPEIVINPLIHPSTLGIFFDVTRPLTSIAFTSANANAYDQATSPGIKSGYLVLEFSFEGMHSPQNYTNPTQPFQYPVTSKDGKRITVSDVLTAVSGFLSQPVQSKNVLSRKAAERAQRRGRSFICWMDFIRDGTVFCGLRVKDASGKYVIMEVLLRQP